MLNNLIPQAKSQVASDLRRGPGRPEIKPARRRKPKSVTLAQELIARFDQWTHKNHMSFSRGTEMALRALMEKDTENADV